MGWWGKLLGGALGFSFGGPLGAALGALIGHSFDKGLNSDFSIGFDATEQERLQAAFFTATFTIMGRMAKADGRVSESEIATARAVMQQMGLDASMRASAMALFNRGKQDSFDWHGALKQFSRFCGRQHNLKQMFLEIQISAALSDGEIHPAERLMLEDIANNLNFAHVILDRIIAMVQAQQYFYKNNWQRGSYQHSSETYGYEDPLPKAYQLLGLPSTADDKEVKKAYRRLMSQHHPDKLVAKGLPEEMTKIATEKTQEIKTAYETIMKSRGKK